MSNAKILGLGVHTIEFGVANDPERIKKMVGNCQHWLDQELDPCRFVDQGETVRDGRDIYNWPVGRKEAELVAVCFGQKLPDYPAVMEKVNQMVEYTNFKKTIFPHLAVLLTQENMAMLHNLKIPWLVPTDESSLWRRDDNHLYALSAIAGLDYRDLCACWIGGQWGSSSHFLFYRDLL